MRHFLRLIRKVSGQAVSDNIIGFITAMLGFVILYIKQCILGFCILGISFKDGDHINPTRSFTHRPKGRSGRVRSTIAAYVASPCLTELDVFDTMVVHFSGKYNRTFKYSHSILECEISDETYEEIFRFTEVNSRCHKDDEEEEIGEINEDGITQVQSIKRITTKSEYDSLEKGEQLLRRQKAGLHGWKGIFEAYRVTHNKEYSGTPSFNSVPSDEFLSTNGQTGANREIDSDDKAFDIEDISNWKIQLHQTPVDPERHDDPDDENIKPTMVEGLYVCTFDLDDFTRAQAYHMLLGLRVHGAARVRCAFKEGATGPHGYFSDSVSEDDLFMDINNAHLLDRNRNGDSQEIEDGREYWYCSPKFESKDSKDAERFRFEMKAEALFHPPLVKLDYDLKTGKPVDAKPNLKVFKYAERVKIETTSPQFDTKSYLIQRIIKDNDGSSEVASHHGHEIECLEARHYEHKTDMVVEGDSAKYEGMDQPSKDAPVVKQSPQAKSEKRKNFHYLVYEDDPDNPHNKLIVQKTIGETPWRASDSSSNAGWNIDLRREDNLQTYEINPDDESTWLYCLCHVNTFERQAKTGNIVRNRGPLERDSWRKGYTEETVIGPADEIYDKVLPLKEISHSSADEVVIVHKQVNDHTFSCSKTRLKFMPHPHLKTVEEAKGAFVQSLRDDHLPWGDHQRTQWLYGYVKGKPNMPGYFPLHFVHEIKTKRGRQSATDTLFHHAEVTDVLFSRRSCCTSSSSPVKVVGNKFRSEFNSLTMAKMVIDINIKSSLIWMGGVASPMLFFLGSLLTLLNFYGHYWQLQYIYLPSPKNLDEATVTRTFNYLWIITLSVSCGVGAYFMADPVTCGPHKEIEIPEQTRSWYEGSAIYQILDVWISGQDGAFWSIIDSATDFLGNPLALAMVVLVMALSLYLLEAQKAGLKEQLIAEHKRLQAELELTRKNAEIESELLHVVEEE
eukprot:SAG31_NODE_336_length_17493_cov_20.694032_10_plen_958_part_00